MDTIQRLSAFAEKHRLLHLSPPGSRENDTVKPLITHDASIGDGGDNAMPLSFFMQERSDYFVPRFSDDFELIREGFIPRLKFSLHRIHNPLSETSKPRAEGTDKDDELPVFDLWGRIPDRYKTISMESACAALRRKNAALRDKLRRRENFGEALQLGDILVSWDRGTQNVERAATDVQIDDVRLDLASLQRISFSTHNSSWELSPTRGAALALVLSGAVAVGLKGTPTRDHLTIEADHSAVLFPPLAPPFESSPLVLTARAPAKMLMINPMAR